MRSVARPLRRRTTFTNVRCSLPQRVPYEVDYRQRRREERRLIRCKKRQQERREREEIKIYRNRSETQKFFKNVKRLTEGFKPGASSCRDERDKLVTDAPGVMEASLFYVIARLQRH